MPSFSIELFFTLMKLPLCAPPLGLFSVLVAGAQPPVQVTRLFGLFMQ